MEYSSKSINQKQSSSILIGIWYLIFIIFIPIILGKECLLMVYLPIVDMIANVFASSGKEGNRLFRDLYNLTPDNILSFISTNFINLVALSGVAMVGTNYMAKTGSRWLAIKIMLVMYTITYLLPTQGLNWIIVAIQNKIDLLRYSISNKEENRFIRLMKSYPLVFDYMGGFIVVILLILIESKLISSYLKWLRIMT